MRRLVALCCDWGCRHIKACFFFGATSFWRLECLKRRFLRVLSKSSFCRRRRAMRVDARRTQSSSRFSRLRVRYSSGVFEEMLRGVNRVAVPSMVVRDASWVPLPSSRCVAKSFQSAILRSARAARRGGVFSCAGSGWLSSWRVHERLRPVRARRRVAGRARGQSAARGLNVVDALVGEDN